MNTTEFEQTVEEVERLLAKRQHSREEILGVLLKVTLNAIHVNEEKVLRERVEREYIKALGFLCAVERSNIKPTPPTIRHATTSCLWTKWYERCSRTCGRYGVSSAPSNCSCPETT